MSESDSGNKLSVWSLILVPAVITLAITLLRLTGELLRWSPRLFSSAPGGGGALIGISWLPFIFGPYFAVKLARAGHAAVSPWKALGLSLVGLVIAIGGVVLSFPALKLTFPGRQVLAYALMGLGALVVNWGWPALFKVLVAYGYAARIPVAIIMFFAIQGHWGTHYDALPPFPVPTSFFPLYMEIAFLPQLVLWIVFTVLMGTLAGSLVAGLVVRHQAPAAAA